jgi:hypothetical protein
MSSKESLKTNSLKDDLNQLQLKLNDALLRIAILESSIDSLKGLEYHQKEQKLPPLVIKDKV